MSNEQISIENLSFQCFVSKFGQFQFHYLETFEFKKSKQLTPVRFESLTTRYLVTCRYFIHYAPEAVDVSYKMISVQYKTTIRTGAAIYKCKFSIKIIHEAFPSDFQGGLGMWGGGGVSSGHQHSG